MKKKSIHKGWSWMACVVLGLALLFACPMAASAVDDPAQDPVTQDPITYIDENGQTQTLTSYHTTQEASYNTPAATGIYWWGQTSGDNWFVLTEDMTCSGPVYLSSKGDTFHLVLCDGVTLTAEQGINILCKGLKIYSTSLGDRMGTLIAKSSTVNPAIGRGQVNDSSIDPDITINGGNIQATVDGANITPSGGLEAVQDAYPAAIGMCGRTGSYGANGGGCITINNGNVTADCSAVPYASAIETKMFERTTSARAGEIRINGGQVTARAHVDPADETKCGTGIGQRLVYEEDGTPRKISTDPVQITLGWKEQKLDFIDSTSWNGNITLVDENKSYVYEEDPTEPADMTQLKGGKLLPAILHTVKFTQSSRLKIDTTEKVVDGQCAKLPEIDMSLLASYIFYGWYEDASDLSTRFDPNEPVTRDYDLTGKLDSIPYKLIFDMQGKGKGSLENFVKKGTLPETIPETTVTINEDGNIVMNQRTDIYSFSEWNDMILDFDNPPTEEGYKFLGFDRKKQDLESYDNYETARAALQQALEKRPDTDMGKHTETYYAVWAKEVKNIDAEVNFPVCGTEVTDGKITSDPNLEIYKDDELFSGTLVGGETYSIKVHVESWPEVIADDTTASINGEAVSSYEVEDGSDGFAATVTGEFVPEHAWKFDGDPSEPVEWEDGEGVTLHAYVSFKCDCGKTNRVEAKVTEKKEYYCTYGRIKYDATLSEANSPDGKRYDGKAERLFPAPGHKWAEPEYVWNDDCSEVKATRICQNDPVHDIETETVTAKSEITKEPTYTEEGTITYTSAAFENPAFEVQTTTVPIPVLEKMTNTLTVKGKTVKLKAAKLKKKKQTIARKKAMTVSKGKGAVTYTKVKVNKKNFAKKFTINKKTGKITVKKGVKKGTYKMTVKVNAAGTTEYKPLAKTVVIKIKVK